MIFSKYVKNLKIYRRNMYLPTLEDSDTPNKKTKSAIFLLTPHRSSSIRSMNHPLFVNMRRYQSYYIEKDITYSINSKLIKDEDRLDEYESKQKQYLNKLEKEKEKNRNNNNEDIDEILNETILAMNRNQDDEESVQHGVALACVTVFREE